MEMAYDDHRVRGIGIAEVKSLSRASLNVFLGFFYQLLKLISLTEMVVACEQALSGVGARYRKNGDKVRERKV